MDALWGAVVGQVLTSAKINGTRPRRKLSSGVLLGSKRGGFWCILFSRNFWLKRAGMMDLGVLFKGRLFVL